ncbi:hypothetical protein SGRIM128S_08752 [Streptomyces griseomycini]
MAENGTPHSRARLYDAFAASGKALASGKRLDLLDLLAQGERTVDALAKAAGLNLTTASAHLQTLKRAGFVATRREGVRIHYRLAGDDVAETVRAAAQGRREPPPRRPRRPRRPPRRGRRGGSHPRGTAGPDRGR